MSDEEEALISLRETTIPVGSRVCVFKKKGDEDPQNTVYFVGYGVYEGDYAFGDENAERAIMTVEEKLTVLETKGKVPTARLRMEDGTVLWGTQVHWIEAEFMQELEKQDTLKVVNIGPKKFLDDLKEFQENKNSYFEVLSTCNVYYNSTSLN